MQVHCQSPTECMQSSSLLKGLTSYMHCASFSSRRRTKAWQRAKRRVIMTARLKTWLPAARKYNKAGAGVHSNAGVINFELLVGGETKAGSACTHAADYTRAELNHYTFALCAGLSGGSRAENGRTLSAKCDCNQNLLALRVYAISVRSVSMFKIKHWLYLIQTNKLDQPACHWNVYKVDSASVVNKSNTIRTNGLFLF